MSLRTHIRLFMQSVMLYTFLDMPLFGTLFPYDLISVELPLQYLSSKKNNIVTESLDVIQL